MKPMSTDSLLRIMTFNIRCDSGTTHEQRWDVRGPLIVDAIRSASPDLLGTQEVLPNQFELLKTRLADYAVYGVGREDGARKGEASAIHYRRDRFELLDRGEFWLSETPAVVGSVGWDADHWMRICTWARLRDSRNSRPILWFNTHFDHSGPIARHESAKLLKRKIVEIGRPDDDVIVTGDFNCVQGSPPYGVLMDQSSLALRDAYRVVNPSEADGPHDGTFHGFQENHNGERIDWILVSSGWRVHQVHIDRERRNGAIPSDHFPVIADLSR